MNILGMGFLELLVVFAIGFVILGPEKMMEMSKKAGKLVGELRKMSSDLQESITIDDEDPRPVHPGVQAARDAQAAKDAKDTKEGPVSFQAEGKAEGAGALTAVAKAGEKPAKEPAADVESSKQKDDDPGKDDPADDDKANRGGLNGVAH